MVNSISGRPNYSSLCYFEIIAHLFAQAIILKKTESTCSVAHKKCSKAYIDIMKLLPTAGLGQANISPISLYDEYAYFSHRAGNISRVVEECHRQRRLLNEEITALNMEVHRFETGQCGVNSALARLTLLFPITSTHHIYQ